MTSTAPSSKQGERIVVNQDAEFEIHTPGIDAPALINDIRARVDKRLRRGTAPDPNLARADRTNLSQLTTKEEFLAVYMECLRDAVFVDINDFVITERRQVLSRCIILFKRLIWKLLKFYTYRLWSQQNQVNGLLLSAVESLDAQYQARLQNLEAEIKGLKAAGKTGG